MRANEPHAYPTVTSDYVFRGVSQSNGDPTIQGGVDYLHSSGVFGGLLAARIDYPRNAFGVDAGRVELDMYLGYGRALGRAWNWDAALLAYEYPDANFDRNYRELAGNLHYRDLARFGLTFSDDAAGGHASGWTAEVELRRPFGRRAQLSGSVGRYAFERSDWQDYLYWDVGVSATLGAATLDLRYFDTGNEAATFAGTTLTGARVVASVSIGF